MTLIYIIAIIWGILGFITACVNLEKWGDETFTMRQEFFIIFFCGPLVWPIAIIGLIWSALEYYFKLLGEKL